MDHSSFDVTKNVQAFGVWLQLVRPEKYHYFRLIIAEITLKISHNHGHINHFI